MSQRDWTSTTTAVAVGVVCGVVALIALAAYLASSGRSGGDWIFYVVVGLLLLGAVEGNNLRKKRRAAKALSQPPQGYRR